LTLATKHSVEHARGVMSCLGDELRRDRIRPRAAVSSPAHVAGPLLGGTAAVLAALVAAELAGLPVLPAVLITVAVGVLAAVAVHRTLGALAAGLALALAQPYGPGEQILIDLPEFDGPTAAEIVHVGAANTALRVDDRLVVVANNRLFSIR
jgi:small-conductance mechanosensitive channel